MELQKYFSLEDYVSKIKLSDQVLFHLQDTSESFDDYFKEISKYGNYAIYFWIDSLYKELIASSQMEGDMVSFERINDLYFSRLNITHNRIHELHDIFIPSDKTEYRKNEVKISGLEDGKEKIYWWGVAQEDVNKFMDDFLSFYRYSSVDLKYSNPFIKSALVHLIFVRIHPYGDGNGRTARLLHNIKFVQLINNIYGSRLKISPLNISENILINKPTYVKWLNAVKFNGVDDDNYAINRFLDFILNMVDEQLYYAGNKLKDSYQLLDVWQSQFQDEELEKDAEVMRLKKIFRR